MDTKDCKYIIPSFLIVPKTKQGMIDYDNVVSESRWSKHEDTLFWFELPYNEIDYLFKHSILWDIDDSCSLWIDEFEWDIIKKEHFDIVDNILKAHKENIPVFYKSFKLAVELDTFLAVEINQYYV